MNSRDYANAAAPEPTQILGLKLKPLSLGHIILLNRHDCAFVCEGSRMAGVDDLLLGLLICSMTFREWVEFEQSPNFLKEIRRWGKKVNKAIRKEKEFNLIQRFCLFKQYIDDGSKIPKVWNEKEADNQPSAAPWYQSVKVSLVSDLGYTNEEAMDAPLQQALLDYFKYAESQGFVRFVTPEEEAMMQAEAAKN